MSIASKIADPAVLRPWLLGAVQPVESRVLAVHGERFRRGHRGDASRARPTACSTAAAATPGRPSGSHRSGLQTIGVDITRVYLEIAVARMGPSRPHLVVGDVENLPVQSASADAVLAYESFHHIPDRRRAMAGYDRVLRAGGRVVFAEPDGRTRRAPRRLTRWRSSGFSSAAWSWTTFAGMPKERA